LINLAWVQIIKERSTKLHEPNNYFQTRKNHTEIGIETGCGERYTTTRKSSKTKRADLLDERPDPIGNLENELFPMTFGQYSSCLQVANRRRDHEAGKGKRMGSQIGPNAAGIIS